MGDMLKISALANSKVHIIPPKPLENSDTVFNLVDLSKIVKTNDRTSEFRQNDTSFTGNNASLLEMQLKIAKNPHFASDILKNLINSDLINQLQQNGSSELSAQFLDFAKTIFLSGGDIVNDLSAQQQGATAFNGKLFDLLHQISEESSSPAIKASILALLKNITTLQSQSEILTSLSSNFKFLSQALSPSKSLSDQLLNLSKLFSDIDARENFPQLKDMALKLMRSVENSLIVTDKLKNMLSLITHNLSRFSDNPFMLKDSFNTLLSTLVNSDQKAVLTESFETFIQGSSLPQASKDALLAESSGFSNLDKLTDQLAKLASQNSSQVDIPRFNMRMNHITQLLEKAIGGEQAGRTNLSIQQGVTTLKEVLSQILPKNVALDISTFMDNFSESKDLNTLITRLSYILKTIPNEEIKGTVAQLMNTVLTELSKSGDIVYKPPTTMENLVEFISKTLSNPNVKSLGLVDSNSLVQSMLTSPGVYTPLLHYLVPVQIDDIRSYGELWVDNEANKDDSSLSDGESSHLFLTFDIEAVGNFELEISTHITDLNITLLCPPALVTKFSNIKDTISKIASSAGYSAKNTKIEPLLKERSLVDIFPRILERRAGLNVKI